MLTKKQEAKLQEFKDAAPHLLRLADQAALSVRLGAVEKKDVGTYQLVVRACEGIGFLMDVIAVLEAKVAAQELQLQLAGVTK